MGASDCCPASPDRPILVPASEERVRAPRKKHLKALRSKTVRRSLAGAFEAAAPDSDDFFAPYDTADMLQYEQEWMA